MTEQINDTSSEVVETPDAQDVFTTILEQEESNDNPRAEVEEEEIQEMPLENFTNYPVGEEGSAFATPDRPWMGPTGETPTPEDPNWQKQIQAAQQ